MDLNSVHGYADSITRLLKERLQVDACCVSLVRRDKVEIRQGCGIPSGVTYSAPGLCFWTLVPEQPQALIIEDLLEDARYRLCPWHKMPIQNVIQHAQYATLSKRNSKVPLRIDPHIGTLLQGGYHYINIT